MNDEHVFQIVDLWHQYGWILAILQPVIIIGFVFIGLHKISGWKKLQEAYPLHAPFTEITSNWHNVNVGGVNFNNSMTIGASIYGLYLRPTTPFHFKIFKPILLPWSQIKVEEKTVLKSIKMIEITPITMEPTKKIRLSMRAYKKVENVLETYTSFHKENSEQETKTQF